MTLRPHTVTVHGDRAADFERVFGNTTVQVRTPIPRWALLPGFEEPQLVYELDIDWATCEGFRERLVAHLAGRFGLPRDVVERDLDDVGMPILAADTVAAFDLRYVL